jgi:opacity protein-like surface antigen
MRKLLLATAAAVVIATPAAAKDNSGYVGIEGGVLIPRDNDADLIVDYSTTQDPAAPVLPVPLDTTFDNAFGVDYKLGYDLDLIAGYDFGMLRVEGELGYKRASLDDFEIDDSDIAALNAALNRPSVAPDPGAPGLPALTSTDFDLSGHVTVLSGMVNALLDFGDEAGFGAYAGGGFGRARVKLLGDSDNAWAWQLIAGLRYAISPNIDVGLKYRYFQTGNVNLGDDAAFALAGNPALIDADGTPVTQTTNAVVATNSSNKFRSHSLLLSLVYNFASAEAPPPPEPAPPPPPPPPAPPATQTCPDGTVILATSTCPAPPPPPPPPPTERGERGL